MLILLLATTSVFCKLEIEFYNYTFNGTSFIYDTRSIPIYEQYNKYIVDLDDIVRPFGGSETDNDFSLFPSTYTNESDFAFNEYPTSDELNTNCGAKYAFYNSMVYDFYGAIAHAYFGVDIQPSVLQFINCHPSEMVWLKKYGQEEVEDLYSGCDTHFQSYSIVSGFTSTSCIGVNGYINDACKTECTDGSSIEYYGRDLLENGKFDYYHLLDGSMLKRLILRFGPVIGQFSQFDSGLTPIYYGWTTDSSNRTHFKSLIRDMYHKLMIHDEISLFRFTGISFVTQIPSEEEQQPITPEQPETPITPPIEEEEEEDPDDPVEDGDGISKEAINAIIYISAFSVGMLIIAIITIVCCCYCCRRFCCKKDELRVQPVEEQQQQSSYQQLQQQYQQQQQQQQYSQYSQQYSGYNQVQQNSQGGQEGQALFLGWKRRDV